MSQSDPVEPFRLPKLQPPNPMRACPVPQGLRVCNYQSHHVLA